MSLLVWLDFKSRLIKPENNVHSGVSYVLPRSLKQDKTKNLWSYFQC